MDDELASEARIHELEARVEELEALRASDSTELSALRDSEQAAHTQLDELKSSNEQLKQQQADHVSSSKGVKQEREKVEGEKRELLEALARSDADRQQLEGKCSQGAASQ